MVCLLLLAGAEGGRGVVTRKNAGKDGKNGNFDHEVRTGPAHTMAPLRPRPTRAPSRAPTAPARTSLEEHYSATAAQHLTRFRHPTLLAASGHERHAADNGR